jgi:hypothetical protein
MRHTYIVAPPDSSSGVTADPAADSRPGPVGWIALHASEMSHRSVQVLSITFFPPVGAAATDHACPPRVSLRVADAGGAVDDRGLPLRVDGQGLSMSVLDCSGEVFELTGEDLHLPLYVDYGVAWHGSFGGFGGSCERLRTMVSASWVYSILGGLHALPAEEARRQAPKS